MPNLRVAVLVDLPREAAAGGHVKYWERVAQAAVKTDAPLDLTIYFSGTQKTDILSPRVRYRYLPPIFSTAKLKFLPYVPAHTDLAPFHSRLAQELPNYDVIQTTEGFFAFARTAEYVARWYNKPIVTSFHTDTPAYAELYTRQTLATLLGRKWGGKLDAIFKISVKERHSKERRLKRHLHHCAAILAMRPEDKALAQTVTTVDKIRPMRLGVDKNLFAPQPLARAAIEQEYGIAPKKFLILFVGRVDAGKNISVLVQACVAALAQGVDLHLLIAGLGPMMDEAKKQLATHVTLAGQVDATTLAGFYAAADCLAVTSDIEIGGMIGLEALACGCPVLVSRVSGMAQACGHPEGMAQVDSGTEAWTQALMSLAQDMPRQKALRDAALAFRHHQLAGWEDVLMQDFLPVWQEVAKAFSSR